MATSTYPLPIPDELLSKLRLNAEKTGLTMAEAARQSMKLGLPQLVERLAVPTGRITSVDPLRDKVLKELYAEREEDLDSMRRFIAAQPNDAQ